LSAPSRRSACRTKRDRFRLRYHILGSDIAGQVEVVGRHATLFRPGEDAFGDILRQMGGFAQYVCVPQGVLAPLPAGMSYEQAAALPEAGTVASQGTGDKGHFQSGQQVLVNGAGPAGWAVDRKSREHEGTAPGGAGGYGDPAPHRRDLPSGEGRHGYRWPLPR